VATELEFVQAAVKALRTGNYKGIHSVYSGFNEAFRLAFPGGNPVETTNALAAQNKIVVRPSRGGVMLYLPGEAPVQDKGGAAALAKMGWTANRNSAVVTIKPAIKKA